MSVSIEARPYGPDSTPEEIEAIKSRIYLHSEGVIMCRELPVMSDFSIEVLQDAVDELLRDPTCEYLILDVAEARRPTAAQRERLGARAKTRRDRIKHIAIVTGRNVLANIAVRFIMSGVFASFSVHKTLEDAELAIRDARQWDVGSAG